MNTEEDEFGRIEREALRRAEFHRKVDDAMRISFEAKWDEDDDTQVYAKPWIGLTWEDMPEEYAGDSSFLAGARWAEARLKERNHD